MTPFQLSNTFKQTIVATFGATGEAWLQQLPAQLAECATRWQLEPGAPYPLSYNYVAPARRADGSFVVLKLGVARRELETEIAALKLYAGQGAVRLLASDAAAGILLLEQLVPGAQLETLRHHDDDQATLIAAAMMEQLWQPVPLQHPFPHLREWIAGLDELRSTFEGTTGPFPAALVERAQSIFAELLALAPEPVVLHGDLHYYNILSAQRFPWLVIDPKGIIGEPGFEVAALMLNPRDELFRTPELAVRLQRRLDLLSERLQLDWQRLHGWSLAFAVLSAWWDYHPAATNWQRTLLVAQTLAALPGQAGSRNSWISTR